MNYSYCKEWDKTLNFLIDNYEEMLVDIPDKYTLNFKWGEKEMCIWIRNYPYAYGTLHYNRDNLKIRPSRHTILKLRKFVNKIENEKNISNIY